MESVQHLKKRLKSIGNIQKITKAMELVAATKMRKSQEIALASRPYAFVALDLLANLSLLEKDKALPKLLRQREIKKVLFVLVSSDKGLAGAFNSLLFKKFEKYLLELKEQYADEEKGMPSVAKAMEGDSNKKLFIAVGEKAFQYLSRKKNPVVKKFVQVGDFVTPEQVQPLADVIVQGYLEHHWDRVVIFSTHFRSALKQEALMRRVLPVDFNHVKQTLEEIIPTTGKFSELRESFKLGDSHFKNQNYLIEPSAKEVLEDLAKHLLFMQIYHLVLEANAAEHSARRMAMKTASDNAADLSETLNLQYNKSRQAAITNQIIEITAGAESLS